MLHWNDLDVLLRGDLKLNKVVVAVTCETGGGGERKTSSLIITVAYTSVLFQLGGMLPQKGLIGGVKKLINFVK